MPLDINASLNRPLQVDWYELGKQVANLENKKAKRKTQPKLMKPSK